MTIHFAAASASKRSPLPRGFARAFVHPKSMRAANDNQRPSANLAPTDYMLRAALSHFAEHGLGAARAARAKAEAAFFAGDREAYDWWLGITRTLDRRLAAQTQQTHRGAFPASNTPCAAD